MGACNAKHRESSDKGASASAEKYIPKTELEKAIEKALQLAGPLQDELYHEIQHSHKGRPNLAKNKVTKETIQQELKAVTPTECTLTSHSDLHQQFTQLQQQKEESKSESKKDLPQELVLSTRFSPGKSLDEKSPVSAIFKSALSKLSPDNLKPSSNLGELAKCLEEVNIKLKEKFYMSSNLLLLEEIKKGAQTSVFKVLDPSHGTFIALKVVLRGNDQLPVDFDAQALREITVLLNILKNNADSSLLNIYSIEFRPGTTYSILMENGKGDLASFFKYKKDLHYDEQADLVDQICRQVIKLKDLNIVHRDIKPGNVIITNDWNFKLTDFGLSEMISKHSKRKETTAAGSPGYWAPEVEKAFIKSKTISTSSIMKAEFYSLGVTLEQLPKGIVGPMNGLYQTLGHLKQDRIYNNGCSPPDRKYLKWHVYNEPYRKHQIQGLLTNLDYRTVICRIFDNYDYGILKEHQKNIIEKMNQIIEKTGKDAKERADMLELLGEVYRKVENFSEAKKLHLQALEIRLKLFGQHHEDVACSYSYLGELYCFQKNYKESLEAYQKSLEINTKVFGSNQPEIANDYHNISFLQFSLNNSKEVIQLHQKALEIRIKELGETNVDVASSYSQIGSAYLTQNSFKESLECYQKALEITIKILGTEHPGVAGIYDSISSLHLAQSNYGQASEFSEKAYEIYSKVFGPNHFMVACNYSNQAQIEKTRGMHFYAKAVELHKKGFEIIVKEFGPIHSNIANAYYNLADSLLGLKNYKEGIEALEKSIEISSQVFGPISQDVASCYRELGWAYFLQEQYEKSMKSFQNSLEINLKAFGSKHLDVAKAYMCLAQVHEEQRRFKEANELFEQARLILFTIYESNHPEIGHFYERFGINQFHQRKYEDALENLQKAIEILTALYGSIDSKLEACYRYMTFVLKELKRKPEIKEFEKKLEEIRIKNTAEMYQFIGIKHRKYGR